MTLVKSKIFGGFIAVFVFFLLIFIGPAQALTLSLASFPASSVEKGSEVITLATISLNTDEIIVNKVEFHIEGPQNRTCFFLTNGSLGSGCSGIILKNFTAVSLHSGYGYGLVNGSLVSQLNYEVRIDTNSLPAGNYQFWTSTHGFSSSKIALNVNQTASTPVLLNTPTSTSTNSNSVSREVDSFQTQEVQESPTETTEVQNPEPEIIEETQESTESPFTRITGNVIGFVKGGRSLIAVLFATMLMAAFITSLITSYMQRAYIRKRTLVSDYNY